MSLPEHEWLAQAKRLAVGMHIRVQHRRESRQNLIIGNESDRYWAYCQKCKEGGVVLKEHARLTEYIPECDSLERPKDLVQVRGSDFEVPVARFLASKNMANVYLPELYISQSTRRLLIDSSGNGAWHGRDLSGKSKSKWLNYTGQPVFRLFGSDVGRCVVVVEDLFSAFKLHWACPQIDVLCALGTGIKDTVAQSCMHDQHIIWMFDNDPAGERGAEQGVRRMRAFGMRQDVIHPSPGCDPKDMPCEWLRKSVQEKLK